MEMKLSIYSQFFKKYPLGITFWALSLHLYTQHVLFITQSIPNVIFLSKLAAEDHSLLLDFRKKGILWLNKSMINSWYLFQQIKVVHKLFYCVHGDQYIIMVKLSTSKTN